MLAGAYWRLAVSTAGSQVASVSVTLPRTGGLGLRAWRWGTVAPRFFFIHGLGEGSFVWNHIIPALLPLGSAVALDLRGHGDSARDPTGRYAISTHVADSVAVLQTLCAQPLILIGHSLGAEVIMHIAAARPHHIRGAVLVDGGPQLDEVATRHIRREFAQQPWHYQSVDEYARHLHDKLPFCALPLLSDMAPYALEADPAGGYRLKCDKAVASCTDQGDDRALWPLFRSISCPMLVVRGAGSAVLPRHIASRMVHENSRCSLETVPVAGHAVMLDNPQHFIDVLHGYARTLCDDRVRPSGQDCVPRFVTREGK